MGHKHTWKPTQYRRKKDGVLREGYVCGRCGRVTNKHGFANLWKLVVEEGGEAEE